MGCSGDSADGALEGPGDDEAVGTVTAPLTGKQRVEIRLPVGVRIEGVALGTAGNLTLGTGASISCSGPPPCTVANGGGTGVTTVGSSSRVPDVSSVVPVVVKSGATVYGFVRSAGTVTVTAPATVSGPIEQQAKIETTTFAWEVTFPAQTTQVGVSTGFRLLNPGSYSVVNVAGSAVVRLRAGTYYVDRLSVASTARLEFDTISGPITLNVGSLLDHQGQTDVVGTEGRHLVTYFGTSPVVLPRALLGPLVAPRADVSVRGSGATTVIGKNVDVAANLTLVRAEYAHWADLLRSVPENGNCLRSVSLLAVARSATTINDDDEDRTKTWFVYAGNVQVGAGGQSVPIAGPSATALAWGDVDGDGRDELAVGKSAIGGPRVEIYDDYEAKFAPLASLAADWGSNYATTALAFGNFDGDPKVELAIGRTEGSGVEVLVLDDQDAGFARMKDVDLGGRHATDLEFADVTGDGRQDLLIARSGRDGSAPGRIVVLQDASTGFKQTTFAAWKDQDRTATAVAVGDLEGDKIPEIAVGRSAGADGRVQLYRFNSKTTQFDMIADWGHNWGDGRRTNGLAFGDVNGDGNDELVVGRNGGCGGCDDNADPRVLVFDTPITDGRPADVKALGLGWGEDRGTNAIAVADFDGDGPKEIVAGRNTGDNDRAVVFDDASADFAGDWALGGGWDDTREVTALAASKQKVCLHRFGERIPETVAEANSGFRVRQQRVLDLLVGEFLAKLDPPGTDDEIEKRVFGEWTEETAAGNPSLGTGLNRVLAGLASIQIGTQHSKALGAKNFAWRARRWLAKSAFAADIGTKNDFDFEMMTMLAILYRFKSPDAPPPDKGSTNEPLIDNATVLNLLLHRRVCPEYVYKNGIASYDDDARRCTFPLAGNSGARKLLDEHPLGIAFPETENHVLMINTWAYLVNQWLLEDPRRQTEVQDFRAAHCGTDCVNIRNAGSGLERHLFSIIGRVVHNDMWETNARAYQVFSVRPLMLLASYASSPDVKMAARNALDSIATKFAFQSHNGRRAPPMRRNWDYRGRMGLYDNDYLPAMLGILTGVNLRDTSTSCRGHLCGYANSQDAEFALQASLTNYRVDPVIHDFMLRPDNRQAGFGVWSRMQARYSERHYITYEAPRYLVPDSPGDDFDLNQQMRTGATEMEPAPEFYFLTRSYLNSAGGRHEEYHGFPNTPLTGESTERSLDFVTRPTHLIAGEDLGYWSHASAAEKDLLTLSGDHHDPWRSTNTGVYKNFAIGYDTVRWLGNPVDLPAHWVKGPEASVGDARFMVVRASSTVRSFPRLDHYVVLGTFAHQDPVPITAHPNLGFWEIVPRQLFPDEATLLSAVVKAQTSNNLRVGAPYQYTLVTSRERLTIDPQYPIFAAFPFLAIDSDTGAVSVSDVHMRDLGTLEKASKPLIQARQVNARYEFTKVKYAESMGDGILTLRNPCLGRELVINSANHQKPTRTPTPFPGSNNPECVTARTGLPQ